MKYLLQITLSLIIIACNSRSPNQRVSANDSQAIDSARAKLDVQPIIFADRQIFPDSSLAFKLITNNVTQSIRLHFMGRDSLFFEFEQDNPRCGSNSIWNYALKTSSDSLILQRFRLSPTPKSSIIYEVPDGECIQLIAIDSIKYRQVTLEFDKCLDESENHNCATEYIGDLVRN
jgi:hypothetical protein